jgi:hypothetical protein
MLYEPGRLRSVKTDTNDLGLSGFPDSIRNRMNRLLSVSSAETVGRFLSAVETHDGLLTLVFPILFMAKFIV